ncbi:MAG TPA: hypothetical protein VHC22_33355 [Pirellulales bacterium]|nr:hypothetical protein [Pirellulales bacterium]
MAPIAVCAACSTASAIWGVSDTGTWPESWPKALEPLRKKSSSIRGSEADLTIHHMPFSDREEFEAAWPHLLKVKTKGAPIILVRSPGTHWHFGRTKAGVLVHCPPGGVEPREASGPLPGFEGVREQWMETIYIELVVDGRIVDLNRIPLPADTPIIDERFSAPQKQDK